MNPRSTLFSSHLVVKEFFCWYNKMMVDPTKLRRCICPNLDSRATAIYNDYKVCQPDLLRYINKELLTWLRIVYRK
ncbi:hypothetical protein Pfo_029763 [Paulownia fortunei]|nr:hypothetical protein Pfo_029763 [Paulownia fortunei]